jgi:hypothetical protein
MRRSNRFLLVGLLIATVLFGSIGGIALAADSEDDSQPEARHEALLDRVLEIYEGKTGVAIDKAALEDAFIQAHAEMRTEAMESHLQSLVDQGQITRAEADEHLEWWQARPDVPAGFGPRGHGGFPGMGGLRGFGGRCAPAQ